MDSAGVGSAGSGYWVGSKGGLGFRVPTISGTMGLEIRLSQLGGHNNKGHNHLSYSLNFLKGDYIGDYIGNYYRDY